MVVWRWIKYKIPTDENLTMHGFSFPSVYNLYYAQQETSQHIFFYCRFACHIWLWLKGLLNTHNLFLSITDCYVVIAGGCSPQAGEVITACIINVFVQDWKAWNLSSFKDKTTHWNSCIVHINALAKIIGNNTKSPIILPWEISLF